MSLELIIDTGKENGLYEPEVLERIERVSERTREFANAGTPLGKTVSLLDILKETHQALNENQSAYYTIPDNREVVAQELLLFENSGSDDLEEIVDSQFSRTRFTIRAPWLDAHEWTAFLDHAEAEYQRILGEEIELTMTGLMVMMTRTMGAAISTMVRAYALAFVLITPLMMLLIGSLRGGLVSMVPNLTPILMTIGLMGWVGIPLDVFSLMIGCIGIGLAVDDTIHFIHGFQRYRRLGSSPQRAIHQTLETTGKALLFTTLVLSAGFFVFMLASMTKVIAFGLLTGFAISMAFIADVTVTPALLVLFYGGRVK
jgi:predicted RND superfamily exporter protein